MTNEYSLLAWMPQVFDIKIILIFFLFFFDSDNKTCLTVLGNEINRVFYSHSFFCACETYLIMFSNGSLILEVTAKIVESLRKYLKYL